MEEITHIRRSNNSNIQKLSWDPSYILDFSDLSAGEFLAQFLKFLACLVLILIFHLLSILFHFFL